MLQAVVWSSLHQHSPKRIDVCVMQFWDSVKSQDMAGSSERSERWVGAFTVNKQPAQRGFIF